MKAYRLMKVSEGHYRIRRASDDGIVGNVDQDGESWLVNVLGKSAKLKSKPKALGFVRGVFAAFTGSYTAHPEPEEQTDSFNDTEGFVADNSVTDALDTIQEGLDSLRAALGH